MVVNWVRKLGESWNYVGKTYRLEVEVWFGVTVYLYVTAVFAPIPRGLLALKSYLGGWSPKTYNVEFLKTFLIYVALAQVVLVVLSLPHI